ALSVFKPDIILADHSLPHFDGLSALKITLEQSPRIPFIFVSGKIGEDFAVDMLKGGATDYVLKNNLSKLPHSVIRALKESKEQRERQIAEKALKKREEEYRLLVENQTDLIIKLDLEGRLLFISKSFSEIFSQNEEDLRGENFLNLLPHNNRPIMQSFLKRLCKPPYSGLIEQEIFTKDGTRCISWANKSVLDKEGKVISIVGVGRDITRQKKAEKALKDSESKYRAIFENTGTLTLIFEKDMTISLVNSEFLKFSGYSQKEVECKLSWLDFVAPEDIERMEGYHRILRLNSSAIPKNYEVSLVNKDGEKKNFFANFDMIPGTNQGLISFMDITDRKIAENKIKRSLKEKELLLREIHHRVKNNLQIISTLLTLQSAQIKDQKVTELYKESQNRIQSMALIHEKLYQSQEISRINLPDYVQTLVSDLFFSYGTDKELIEPV
ncbi:MAG: PAS domain S-box protein, partial [Methanobacterium sp.]|nr:PAS domain S-box protein [Methanobacterium sp.]